MKTLGIIGGIAPASTIEYYRLIVATYQARQPDGSGPPVIINSIDLQTMLRRCHWWTRGNRIRFLTGYFGTLDSLLAILAVTGALHREVKNR